jgi:hypothetical protein
LSEFYATANKLWPGNVSFWSLARRARSARARGPNPCTPGFGLLATHGRRVVVPDIFVDARVMTRKCFKAQPPRRFAQAAQHLTNAFPGQAHIVRYRVGILRPLSRVHMRNPLRDTWYLVGVARDGGTHRLVERPGGCPRLGGDA